MSGIVIIGGGIMGSATAYHLALAGAAADVTVVEPDPTYEFAASPRAVGGIRLQHALAENVAMSIYGNQVYSNFATEVTGGKVEFDPGWFKLGYLYMVRGAAGIAALERNAAMQRGLGVETHMLDLAELRRRWPFFKFLDTEVAELTPDDGQIDPNAALMGFRRAAEGRGIRYLKDRVVGLEVTGRRITTVRLESGGTLVPDQVLNVANCWAAGVSAIVGMKLPVEPVRRQTFNFLTQETLPAFPAMRHMTGFALRAHRGRYIAGYTKPGELGGFNWNLDHDVFENLLWPELAEQGEAFETIKPQGGWVGHYDMCRLDGNPIIDRWDGLDNFYVAAGFSGHGLQHAPAVGRALKELMLEGRFSALDLSRLGYRRVVENQPLPDDGPVA